MEWDLEVKRLIFDELNDVYPPVFEYIKIKIVDNRLIVSVIYQDEAKDFEIILKEIDVNQQTPGLANSRRA